jgi:HSP20 family protein
MKAELLDEGIGHARVSSPHFCVMPDAAPEITSPHLCVMASAALQMYRQSLMNIANTEAAFVLTVEMPGVAKDGVEVTLNGRLVEVEGRRAAAEEPGCTHRETVSKLFYRWLELPEDVEASKVQTEMADGVLRVVLPKKAASKAKTFRLD